MECNKTRTLLPLKRTRCYQGVGHRHRRSQADLDLLLTCGTASRHNCGALLSSTGELASTVRAVD